MIVLLKSMTGYGKSTVEVGDTKIHVEIRSVNHRFLDITTKMPHGLLFMEERLKQVVKGLLTRGRVDIFVTLEGETFIEKKIDVNWKIVDQYFTRLKDLQRRYDLTGDISIDMVSKLDHVFSEKEMENDADEWQMALLEAMDNAARQLVEMRLKEGHELYEDLKKRITEVRRWLSSLDERRPMVIEEYKERIRARIEEYTKEQLRPDETKILQEVALLAEKGDITEELTRLQSHFIQFEGTLSMDEPVGRRLDFIVQEMHREVNTIGSKSNDGKMTEMVVNLKSEMEKVKEQVQNIE
ncbi:YicC/YloC family endoribonuclease [Halobacillus sp. HZG1]|uniref:YicC/YloC family endoribonuclease n=1 Tax=Halobacillus sp. HZG1 TaxID=3111769 RepID=UPI002DB6C91E|nr:YicC/YloC family endoribonuclease [Halobacillus sp. HZG1]MEC3886153.1 YicC/YloC family endoribonuclease [Halobacillus sp. HZG1]